MTAPSDSVLHPRRIAHARYLSDTTYSPIVTSKSVVRQCLIADHCRTVIVTKQTDGRTDIPLHTDQWTKDGQTTGRRMDRQQQLRKELDKEDAQAVK